MTFLSPPENAKFKTLAVPRLKNIQFARRNLQPETNEETPKKPFQVPGLLRFPGHMRVA